jgi:hypothetical protein
VLGVRVVGLEGASAAWSQLRALPEGAAAQLTAARPPAEEAGLWRRTLAANRRVLAGLTAFEDGLDDESLLGRALRPPAQRLLSGWLGAGNERTYIGREGWLFYRPDVEHVTGAPFLDPAQMSRRVRAAAEWEAPPQPDPRPAIVRFHRDLAARGILLLLVPTPVKPTVHPEQLAGAYEGRTAPVQNPSYEALLEDLRAAGVLVLDLSDALVAERVRAGRPQYLATDTHWRPDAMEQAARRLADLVGEHVTLEARPDPGHRLQSREVRQLGDIAAMLDLPADRHVYAPEAVWVRRVVGPDGAPWRPSRDADVLLLGDSFTNIFSLATMGWGDSAGFAEHLSAALARPVDRIVQNDAGAYATRDLLRRALAADPARLDRTRVVVYQFATRELSFGDWRVIDLPARSRLLARRPGSRRGGPRDPGVGVRPGGVARASLGRSRSTGGDRAVRPGGVARTDAGAIPPYGGRDPASTGGDRTWAGIAS